MNILITNDDGIHAEGLLALKQGLERVGQVHIVAPDRPRSACGHSITLHKPLRAERMTLADGSIGYATNGTPSDCVSIGLLGIVEVPIDMVFSGINRGPNLGWDLTYSGTVSAAMEGAISGLPSVSISVASHEANIDYSAAADVACKLAAFMREHTLPENTLLNVNVPALPINQIKGFMLTRQGKREYLNKLETRTDPGGRKYYWLGGDVKNEPPVQGTDVQAVHDGYVSVTPVHLDLTDHVSVSLIDSWGLQSIDLSKCE